MPGIQPFRALRYNTGFVGDLSRVIAPPYDVIGPEAQDRLYQASPYNVIRLILGKLSPSDTAQENRYTRAKRDFIDWCGGRILEQDEHPALYLIEQAFDGADGVRKTRLGFIALMELSEGAVYKHEATLAAPKQDRTKLLEAVPANLEPIFCVYPDDRAAVHRQLQDYAARTAPAAQATLDGDGIRLWALTDRAAIEEVQRRLTPVTALIADGHHRFEVAYANRQRYAALMTYFVSMEEPSLIVRPIHRVLKGLGESSTEQLRDMCQLELAQDAGSVLQWLKDGEGRSGSGRFGYYDGYAFYRAIVRQERLQAWLSASRVPAAMASLDVSLLHGLILPSLANGAAAECLYAADATQAVQTVDQGERRSAWLLRGIPLAQVYTLAGQGLSLPPKSTYFYPKVPSGLTINPLT